MDLVHKTWNVTTPPLKKLLARTITHLLSRQVDQNKFEVVYEGFLDAHNPEGEQADVVIYSKQSELKPAVAVEICSSTEELEMILLAKSLMEHYGLKEFFIYVLDTGSWKYISNDGRENNSSFSTLLSADLNRMINLYPYEDLRKKMLSRKVS